MVVASEVPKRKDFISMQWST